MRSPSAVVIAALGLGAAGCTAATEAREDVGFVLLDREAQAAGSLSHGDWEGRPMLPVALEVSEKVTFTSSAGASSFSLRPGTLAWVHGPGGAIEWMRVGEDVSEDRLRVYASRDAADELAQRLAGEVKGGGDGLWTVSAPDVFERGSFLAVPAGVQEIAPDPRIDVKGAGKFGLDQLALPSDLPEAARQLTLVGLYTAEGQTLFLDSAGGFSLEDGCSGEPSSTGRWRADGQRVILESSEGKTVLAYDSTQGDLHDPSGRRFASALVDSTVAPMPSRGEP